MKVIFVPGWLFNGSVFKTAKKCLEEIVKNSPTSKEKKFPPAITIYEDFKISYKGSVEEEVENLLPKYNNEDILVGWSLGATISILAALRKLPAGLILIGATPYFKKAWREDFIKKFLENLNKNYEETVKRFRKEAFSQSIEETLLPPKEKAISLLKSFIETDIFSFKNSLQLGEKTEIIVIHGRKDTIVPFKDGLKLHKTFKKSIFIPYKGGHFPEYWTTEDWKKIFDKLIN